MCVMLKSVEQSEAYKSVMEAGRITFSQFATDPCKAIFKGAMTALTNANVSINKVAGEYVAMTETPLPIAFDPRTLETLGVVHYDDHLQGHHGSAHPHYDRNRCMSVSYHVEFGMQSTFQVWSIKDGTHRREPIGSYPVMEPSYIHSFGMTENYIVIAEYPYRVNPLNLLTSGKPFIENYEWRPQEPALFLLMNKHDGQLVGRYEGEAMFSFHHVNAFEQDGEVVVDLAAYRDASSIQKFYLDRLRAEVQQDEAPSDGEFRRYRLPLSHPGTSVNSERLSEQAIELPTINYRRYNASEYGVAYGVGTSQQHSGSFINQLLRVDTRQHITKAWYEEGCYPGEPVFADSPEARAEDDGVVLSVVLDARKGNSFLLVLDAATFEEIGRAEVPHHIPFGFHRQYFPRVQ